MKIECISNIDPQTNEMIDNNWISLHKVYLVLSLEVTSKGEIRFIIMTNNGRTPGVLSSVLFRTTCPKIPSNWVCKYEDSYLVMGPEKWMDDSLWEYSFWESYHSLTCPEAEKVFKEELEKMIAEVG
ncbi:MAG: hypothetical protein J0H68_05855 [Sphingobacteriia bacterium]|nr:hypothetical protein [Sphingobacteriia bacterium]